MHQDDELEAAEQIAGELFAEFVIPDSDNQLPAAPVAARAYRAGREVGTSLAAHVEDDYVADFRGAVFEARRVLHERATSDAYWAEVLRLLSDDPWWTEPEAHPGWD